MSEVEYKDPKHRNSCIHREQPVEVFHTVKFSQPLDLKLRLIGQTIDLDEKNYSRHRPTNVKE